MPRALRIVLVVAVVLLAVPAIVAASPDGTATVAFGQAHTGSPFPPPEHDASFNAKDNLVPRTVAIASGGTVTYVVAPGVHQPAVYGPGTRPEDIRFLGIPSGPNDLPLMSDPAGRLDIGPFVFPGEDAVSWTPAAGTFAQPGRYLVICNFMPHLVFAKMYGWVQVK